MGRSPSENLGFPFRLPALYNDPAPRLHPQPHRTASPRAAAPLPSRFVDAINDSALVLLQGLQSLVSFLRFAVSLLISRSLFVLAWVIMVVIRVGDRGGDLVWGSTVPMAGRCFLSACPGLFLEARLPRRNPVAL